MTARFGSPGLLMLEQYRQTQSTHSDLSQPDHRVASVKHRVVSVARHAHRRRSHSITIDRTLV
jgi:hypothetical protein